jgi:hypothetical protein
MMKVNGGSGLGANQEVDSGDGLEADKIDDWGQLRQQTQDRQSWRWMWMTAKSPKSMKLMIEVKNSYGTKVDEPDDVGEKWRWA